MLAVLKEIEEVLPELLKSPDGWESVFVDYHRPFVERLWRSHGAHRIMLHRIYPCAGEDALFHPHPWPSAMRILRGRYEMIVGWGNGETPPHRTMTLALAEGSTYEMTDPDLWHYVAPTNTATLTLMVTGKPWKSASQKSDKPLGPLTMDQRSRLLAYFRLLYPD